MSRTNYLGLTLLTPARNDIKTRVWNHNFEDIDTAIGSLKTAVYKDVIASNEVLSMGQKMDIYRAVVPFGETNSAEYTFTVDNTTALQDFGTKQFVDIKLHSFAQGDGNNQFVISPLFIDYTVGATYTESTINSTTDATNTTSYTTGVKITVTLNSSATDSAELSGLNIYAIINLYVLEEQTDDGTNGSGEDDGTTETNSNEVES